MNSTIKDKIGKCIDCPDGTPEQPIIAGRCKRFHYQRHRSRLNAAKEASKIKTRKPLPKVSKKRAVENAKYTVKRLEFLGKPENKICPVTGKEAIEIHHKLGRIGFADQWARINNMSLLLDSRFWLAVSREGHMKIEMNPEWAKENGYSLDRLNTI